MKFVVEGRRLKVLTKSVRFLARYSETTNIIIDSTGFVFKAVNDTRSSYVEVRYKKDFFCESSLSEDDDPSFQCKVDIKSLQMVFRVLNLDRTCEKCIIRMDKENHKIKVEMRVKNHIHREYVIPFMEHEVLRCPLVSTKMANPTMKSSAKFLTEVFSNFVQSTKEATIWLFDNNIRFKNFMEKDAPNYYEVANTNFTILATEFSAYNYVHPFSVTFNVKDVKSFVEFGCHQNQIINTYLLNDLSPIELNFICTSDNYAARVVLATFEFDASTQPQPPPFNPSQRSSYQSQTTCTTLNYTMSSANMSPPSNPPPATTPRNPRPAATPRNPRTATFRNPPPATTPRNPPSTATHNSPLAETHNSPSPAANHNIPSQAAVRNSPPPAEAQNDSVGFSMNTPSNSAGQGISENINEIIQSLPNFSDPQDDGSEPIDYIIDYEGTQLREYHKHFFYGLDSQEKDRVNFADLETIVSDSEEEI